MGSRASGHSRMSLNSRNNGCSTPASPVVVDVMATIDPLAPRTWAGVYEIFEPRSRIATRSLRCVGLWSLLPHSWPRRFPNSRRGIRQAPGLAWGWRPPTPASLAIGDVAVLARRLDTRRSEISAAAPLTAPTGRAIGWLAICRARGAEHDETPILRDHEFPGGALAVCQGAQKILAAADHPDVGGVRRSGRAHVRFCIRSVRLYAVLSSSFGSSAFRRFIPTVPRRR